MTWLNLQLSPEVIHSHIKFIDLEWTQMLNFTQLKQEVETNL